MKKIIISGGHFVLLNGEPVINEGTLVSFRFAVDFYIKKRNDGYNVSLSVLINDIGEVCEKSFCSIFDKQPFNRENFLLPKEYIEVLNENKLTPESVLFFWEKHVKNRAKKFLRRKVKEGYPFLEKVDALYYKHNSGREIPISKKMIHDKYGSLAYLLIMAFFTKEQERLGFNESFNFYYIGPAGGAITTLFALRSLDKFVLLNKVEIYLLDIVPDVIEITQNGDFQILNEMIEEYGFNFTGKDGELYKKLMQSKKVHGIVGDGETFPKQIKEMDISVVAYTHHNMNLIARKNFSEQMEQATKNGGFFGVVDSYKKTYDDYMSWYKPHFKKHKTPPPVEYPLIDAEILADWYSSKVRDIVYLENTFVFWIKK